LIDKSAAQAALADKLITIPVTAAMIIFFVFFIVFDSSFFIFFAL
jgi:hypothetical protein